MVTHIHIQLLESPCPSVCPKWVTQKGFYLNGYSYSYPTPRIPMSVCLSQMGYPKRLLFKWLLIFISNSYKPHVRPSVPNGLPRKGLSLNGYPKGLPKRASISMVTHISIFYPKVQKCKGRVLPKWQMFKWLLIFISNS